MCHTSHIIEHYFQTGCTRRAPCKLDTSTYIHKIMHYRHDHFKTVCQLIKQKKKRKKKIIFLWDRCEIFILQTYLCTSFYKPICILWKLKSTHLDSQFYLKYRIKIQLFKSMVSAHVILAVRIWRLNFRLLNLWPTFGTQERIK